MRIGGRAISARTWLLVGLLFCAAMLGYFDRQMVPIAKQSLSLELNWSENNYATLIACGQAAAALALLLGAGLIDRLRVRWAASLVIGAGSLAALCNGFAWTLGQHIASRMAMSAAQALAVPAFLKALRQLLPVSHRATGIGLASAASALGAIAAPVLIPQAITTIGWRQTFIIAGTIGVALAAAWALLARRTPAVVPVEAADVFLGSHSKLLTSARLWGIAGAKTLSDATWWLLLYWLPDFFGRSFGLGEARLGTPMAIIYALSAIGSVLAGLGSTRLLQSGKALDSVRSGFMLTCACLTAFLPAALLAEEVVTAALLIGIAVAAHQGFSVNLFALMTEVSHPGEVARISGFAVFCGNLGGMLVALAAGLVLTAGWGYAPLLIAAPFCYLLALGWLRWLMPRLDRSVVDTLDKEGLPAR